MSPVSIILTALKRPTTWAVGVIGTAVATHITNLSTPIEAYVAEKVAPYYCEYRQYGQKPIIDDSQFNILVNRLTNDPWLSHRDRVMHAFLGEKGFHAIPICESFNFDYAAESQAAADDTFQHVSEVIKARHADLLLFGEVRKPDDAVMIYAMNEHGSCDRRPKPTLIEHGDLPDDFNAEEKRKLIEVSLREIESACRNQSSIDWTLFAKRMNKMESFWRENPLESTNGTAPLAMHYLIAVSLLYSNGQGDIWFTNGEQFAKKAIEKFRGNNLELSGIWLGYAYLLVDRI